MGARLGTTAVAAVVASAAIVAGTLGLGAANAPGLAPTATPGPPGDSSWMELDIDWAGQFDARADEDGLVVGRVACTEPGPAGPGEAVVRCYGTVGPGELFVADAINTGDAIEWQVVVPAPEPATGPVAPVRPPFDDGVHVVGDDIVPGRYVATPTGACSWARLSAPGNAGGIVLAEANTEGERVIVDIGESDGAFESQGCGVWLAYHAPDAPFPRFGDGMYVVGDDIEPGRYRSGGDDDCRWLRVSAFTGEAADIIDTNLVEELDELDNDRHEVEILATDEGFISAHCSPWTRI